MRGLFLAATPFALLAAAPADSAVAEATSWGKADVTMEQYRQDGLECGRAGYYRDVADTEAARVFKTASGQLEANEAGLANVAQAGDANGVANIVDRSARIVEGTRPAERFREVRALQESVVASCLRRRGYVPFLLTRAQQAQLQRLHLGSPERRAFLHGLASDPKILSAQAI